MICPSVYLLVLIQNFLVHLAEKTLLIQPLTFRGNYPGSGTGQVKHRYHDPQIKKRQTRHHLLAKRAKLDKSQLDAFLRGDKHDLNGQQIWKYRPTLFRRKHTTICGYRHLTHTTSTQENTITVSRHTIDFAYWPLL